MPQNEELPGMPDKSKLTELFETLAEQTDDINKRRAIRRETKDQIIEEMRARKKGTIKFVYGGYNYRFSIVPGDAKLNVQVTPLKANKDA